ncbi:transporter [Methylocapsa sp. D3K7]|uniref:SphA family protein n=1 Tax=Methylocapsa sp. D3K7 TaxID=3041435 RepID=UPI00244E5EBF|nr:transporter [Methylocapsa sp. D3K7]WGJ15341.1 transporter [Methylocapsa sp. D3K7]
MRLSSPAAKSFYAILILASSLFATPPVRATEYGLGDYLLGYSLPMAGYTPPPGIYFSDTFYLYEGSANANIKFPIGRNIDAGVSYNFLFNIVQTTWVTDVKLLGGSLGFAALIPFGGEQTSASLSFSGPLGVPRQLGRTASIDALGDSAFAAFLGWEAGEHHWNATLTGFAPTGYYSSTALAFTGLHRPGLDLKAGYTFLSLQTGIEASAAVGVTVNAINTTTDYQSGAELHVEGALNEHLPFGLAAGVGGYYYQQITPDGGSGDRIGAFRGRVAAIGPLLSYTFKAGDQELTLSGKWFHEFDVAHRVQGNAVFASLTFRI